MRPLHFWLALVVMLAVHGTAPADFIATATLTGDGESPSPATGHGTVTYNAAAQTLGVLLTFGESDLGEVPLTSPTKVPAGVPGAAHIHYGTPPPPGGPIIFPFLDFPTGITSGTYSTILNPASILLKDPAAGINNFTDAVNAIKAGHTYFNVHTALYPGGEIAGQISVVPEPASLTLMGLGLVGGLLAYACLRRRPAV